MYIILCLLLLSAHRCAHSRDMWQAFLHNASPLRLVYTSAHNEYQQNISRAPAAATAMHWGASPATPETPAVYRRSHRGKTEASLASSEAPRPFDGSKALVVFRGMGLPKLRWNMFTRWAWAALHNGSYTEAV